MLKSNKKRAVYLLLAIVALFAAKGNDVYAQDENSNVISTGVPFLLIGPNSRFSGMGETGTAVADDATAMHWNPAGLAFQGPGTEIDFTHSPWLAGLNIGDLFYDYIAAKKDIKSINGTVGASLTYLNIGEIIFTDEAGRLDESKNYKAYELAFALGYATKLSKDFGMGITTRFIYSRLSPHTVGGEQGSGTAFTMSFDIAGMYRPTKGPKFLKDRFSIGLNLSNLGPKISYVDADQADPIPTQIRLGLAYEVFKNEGNSLTLTTDFAKLLVHRYKDDNGDFQSDPFYEALFTSWSGDVLSSIQTSIGAEYWYGNPKLIALRAGYFYEDPSYGNRKFITLGAGIRYSLYGFDFSYIDALEENHPLANTLRFGLSVNFK
ncbi:MAG: type IX secretion system outer membrane channel protein PorV [Ignavibacteriae bacterium]|nr:type IX secretion system outer membrane channel protein PorV [Ignavibacteriota bacterium]MCB9243292.1 type IX secretion system outer membrane channel protein PorV [Ignavibacteriales bacterium]